MSPLTVVAPEGNEFKFFTRSSINKLNRIGHRTSPRFTPRIGGNYLLNPFANLILKV